MIAYVTIGTDNIDLARKFYSAFLPVLGYELTEHSDGLAYALPETTDQSTTAPEIYIKKPFDGNDASCGNGMMVGYEASCQEDVRSLHAAALEAGGSDEGQPGFREIYSPDFYVAYLRDPQGNKLAIFSCNPDDPRRDD